MRLWPSPFLKLRQPPASAHCGREGVGAYVCCQLCPCAKQLAPLVPSFLTLGPELDNVGAAARLMEVRGHNFRLLLSIFSHGVRVK